MEVGYCFLVILVVCPGHGSFYTVAVVIFFFEPVVGRGLKLPKSRNLRKKNVVSLYLS